MIKNRIILALKKIRDLNPKVQSNLKVLKTLLLESKSDIMVKELDNFSKKMGLDDKSYADLLDYLIFTNKIHLDLSEAHKVELKKLVRRPNLRLYLKGPWF